MTACNQHFTRWRRPGTAKWFKFTSPGAYAFRVNPNDDIWAGKGTGIPSDNGMVFEVYKPTNLSRPISPVTNQVTTVYPGGLCCETKAVDPDPSATTCSMTAGVPGGNASGCPYQAGTYDVPPSSLFREGMVQQ